MLRSGQKGSFREGSTAVNWLVWARRKLRNMIANYNKIMYRCTEIWLWVYESHSCWHIVAELVGCHIWEIYTYVQSVTGCAHTQNDLWYFIYCFFNVTTYEIPIMNQMFYVCTPASLVYFVLRFMGRNFCACCNMHVTLLFEPTCGKCWWLT